MAKKTRLLKTPRFRAVKELIKKNDVRILSLMHIGGDGTMKTLDFVPRNEKHLDAILEVGERADGSSLFSNSGIQAKSSDVLLRPRPETAFVDPFSEVPTVCVLCRHVSRDGEPLEESPDSLVFEAYQNLLNKTGMDLWALGEVEYFLGYRPGDRQILATDEAGYHASEPMVFGQALRRKALSILSKMNVPIKYAHSEVGYVGEPDEHGFVWEQHEIEMDLAPLPQAAESVALVQWVLRNLAYRSGLRVDFDPILREGHAGSGLHFHMSPKKDGKAVQPWRSEKDIPVAMQRLIAGLVCYGASLMAFGNRSSESFVRLRQGKEAPKYVMWGQYDRRALIRIPSLAISRSGQTKSTPTIEFRLPDGSAHPYWLLAGIAQVALKAHAIDNLEKILSLSQSKKSSLEQDSAVQALPKDFLEVARLFQEHRSVFEADNVFPVDWIDRMISHLKISENQPS